MTRRDWWLGVGLVVFALLLHAVPLPRHTYQNTGGDFVRIDRWLGGAERGYVWAGGWVNGNDVNKVR